MTDESREGAAAPGEDAATGTEEGQPRTAGSLLGLAGRGIVLTCFVAVAAWTLCYQVGLITGISALPTLAVSAVLTIALLAAVVPRALPHLPARTTSSSLPGGLASLGAVAATGTALTLAILELRASALLVGGLAASVALVTICRGTPRRKNAQLDEKELPIIDASSASRWLWPTGWVAGVASAYVSTRLARTDGDDAYFVNFSTWVADRGYFPLNDTMISQNEFPAGSAHSPPTHSVEALIGALARLSQIEAGSITYLVVTPTLTLIGVLILTWAIDEARIPTAPAALAAAVGYLWTTGATGYSFGSFFAVRMWQGKAMLVSLAVPLILILGSKLLREGTWRHHLLFGCAVVAAVGFSNTSAFLVPLLLGAVFVAGVALRRFAGAVRVLAWALYPAACGAVSYVAAPTGATTASRIAAGFATTSAPPANPLETVPGENGILVATVLAIGLGSLGIRSRTIRAIVAGSVVVTAISLLPPVRDVLETFGLRSVVWRLWWLLPVPLLIGGLVGAATGRVQRLRMLVAWPLAVALALLPLVGGRWVGAETSKTRVVPSTSWKVPRGAFAEAQYTVQISSPGDMVLMPSAASSVLAALTVEVQPVSARVYYLSNYASDPAADAGARRELQLFIDKRTPKDVRSLDDELELLDVRTVCVRSTREGALKLLQGAGYATVGVVKNLTCLRR